MFWEIQMLSLDQFRKEFDEKVVEQGITWEAKGFYASNGRVYPFGTDTKVLSTVFESFCAPLILEIAAKYGYVVAFAKQTVYPDFTLTPIGKSSKRIAIDIKTTYQEGNRNIVFTLGSYTSFLRDGKKNISFPYNQYSGHWIIGFVYERCGGIASKVHEIKKIEDLICPFKNVRYFIQEKYRIAGQRPGSGNTTNIGSFPTKDIEDLRQGNGPFSALGERAFEEYWRKYRK
jgi:hypothetical protein